MSANLGLILKYGTGIVAVLVLLGMAYLHIDDSALKAILYAYLGALGLHAGQSTIGSKSP